jgi:hypothetical protein
MGFTPQRRPSARIWIGSGRSMPGTAPAASTYTCRQDSWRATERGLRGPGCPGILSRGEARLDEDPVHDHPPTVVVSEADQHVLAEPEDARRASSRGAPCRTRCADGKGPHLAPRERRSGGRSPTDTGVGPPRTDGSSAPDDSLGDGSVNTRGNRDGADGKKRSPPRRRRAKRGRGAPPRRELRGAGTEIGQTGRPLGDDSANSPPGVRGSSASAPANDRPPFSPASPATRQEAEGWGSSCADAPPSGAGCRRGGQSRRGRAGPCSA